MSRKTRERDARGRPRWAGPRDRLGRPLPRGRADELAGRIDADAFDGPLEDALRLAVERFDGARFFEAHELFEHVWKRPDVPADDREFWKGVTQVAVALCHVERGNSQGARALLARAGRRLAGYPPVYRGVRTRDLVASARAAAAQAERGRRPVFPSFPLAGRPGER